jgi:oligopeptide transport system substrate-binding protein
LRPDAEWSDGAPVTAHDFVFAYHRILEPELASPCAAMLADLDPEAGVSAPDDFTLRLRLRRPVSDLPALTRHHAWFPVPRHVILQHGTATDRFNPWSIPPNLVGNGPFRLQSWRLHDRIEVERNPGFRDATHVKLNGIRFLVFENPHTETLAFLAGQLHITRQVPSDVIGKLQSTAPQSLHDHCLLDPRVHAPTPQPAENFPWQHVSFGN